jgi:hypothetical protein
MEVFDFLSGPLEREESIPSAYCLLAIEQVVEQVS